MEIQPGDSEYTIDALTCVLDKYGIAREELEDVETEELAEMVVSMYDDLLGLDHGEYAVYATARDLLFDRGCDFRTRETFEVVLPDGEVVS